MKSKTCIRIIALISLAVLAIAVPLAAQDQAKKTQPHQYHHYQIADAGTFGGPQSYMTLGTLGAVGVLNNQGAFGGWGDTTAIDPICLNHPPDCYANDAFIWQNGAKIDLGLLPDGINSQVNWVSGNGLVTGNADNTHTDPVLGTPFQIRGSFWGHDHVITDIGALPGTYFAGPIAVNNRGEVVGAAMNTVPDSNSMWGLGYQTRAFYWKNGSMQDLGTLGTGTDAVAGLINERGQVVGVSYTNASESAFCANFGYPITTGSFIWDHKGGMRDIGSLGGTCTLATDLNNRSQIVGVSSLAGDQTYHPFVWDEATGMTALMDASNGFTGYVNAINDRGQIVGEVCDAVTCYAALWQKRGGKWQETDLGIFAVGGCPNATSVNASAQVIGTDYCTNLPFLSEDGAAIVDLNTLVPSNSGLQLNEAGQINDRGEIAINATDASLNNHTVVLIPCDENHPGVEGCDYDLVDAATAAARSSQNPARNPEALSPGARMPGVLNRFRFPKGRPVSGHGAMPAPAAHVDVPANAATTDWLADRLPIPAYQQPTAYCEISSSSLTGYCVAISATFACSVLSNVCPQGESASSSGISDCNGSAIRVSTTKCDSAGFSLSGSSALSPGTISEGASSTSTLSVTAFGGFSGPVAFTCTVSPTPMLAPTCWVSPSSVAPGTNATLTVRTTAPTSASRLDTGSRLAYASFLPFGALFTMLVRSRSAERGRRKLAAVMLVCILVAGVAFQSGCGASKTTPGTPAGLYLVTVTGTDASGTLVSTTTLPPLTVQ